MKHVLPLLSLVLAAALGLPAAAAAYARPETPAAQPADDPVKVKALMRQGNHFYDDGRYDDALAKAEAVLAIDATHAGALDLKRRCREAIEARRRKEEAVFDRACATGTLEALQQFVKDNPANQYVPAARERIADFARWDRTRAEGTMEAYEQYLASSPTKAFEKEARAAMLLIEAEQVWNSMGDNYTAEGLQLYQTSYPDSPHRAEAAARLDELKGMEAYRRRAYEDAYRLLGRARSEITLTLEASHAYNTAADEHDYAAALRAGTMEAWRGYIAGHPRGRHAAEARDAMALLRLDKLTPFSTESEMTTCRTMAATDATQRRIDTRLATLRSERRAIDRRSRRRAHRRWWNEVEREPDGRPRAGHRLQQRHDVARRRRPHQAGPPRPGGQPRNGPALPILHAARRGGGIRLRPLLRLGKLRTLRPLPHRARLSRLQPVPRGQPQQTVRGRRHGVCVPPVRRQYGLRRRPLQRPLHGVAGAPGHQLAPLLHLLLLQALPARAGAVHIRD